MRPGRTQRRGQRGVAGALTLAAVGCIGVALVRSGRAGQRSTTDRDPPVQTVDGRGVSRDLSGGAPLRDRRRARAALGSGHLVAPTWEPAALTALAAWVPQQPATAFGRAVATLWASPLTAVGLLVALASGAMPRPHGGAWVAAPARGLFAFAFTRRGFAACTLGHVIVAADEPSDALFDHEIVHVRQGERFGPLMAPAYLGLMAIYGYARHPMERAARAGARRATAARSPAAP